MVPKIHPYHRDLRRYGFLSSMKSFLFMVYPHVEGNGLLSPEAWHVNRGNADVI
jgi:hypothetical protein